MNVEKQRRGRGEDSAGAKAPADAFHFQVAQALFAARVLEEYFRVLEWVLARIATQGFVSDVLACPESDNRLENSEQTVTCQDLFESRNSDHRRPLRAADPLRR